MRSPAKVRDIKRVPLRGVKKRTDSLFCLSLVCPHRFTWGNHRVGKRVGGCRREEDGQGGGFCPDTVVQRSAVQRGHCRTLHYVERRTPQRPARSISVLLSYHGFSPRRLRKPAHQCATSVAAVYFLLWKLHR